MDSESIKVRATAEGLYPGDGLIRNPGDEFEITSEKHFSSKWMEKVDVKPAKPVKADKEK